MPISTSELLKAVAILARKTDLKVAVKKSAKGAVITGAASFLGGMLMGPAGLAAGGLVGGVTAMMTQGGYRSVSEVLLYDLSSREKELFVQHIQKAVEKLNITDLAMLLPLLLKDASIQQTVLAAAVGFVTNQMGMNIID